jgi:hypothetical protein
MKLLALITALCATGLTGCSPILGVHVHRFHYQGIQYVHCTVVVEQRRSDLAQQSLDVCKDAINENPQTERPEPYKK